MFKKSFLKYLAILPVILLAVAMLGCFWDKEDDNTCSDAAENMVNVILDEYDYSTESYDICYTLYLYDAIGYDDIGTCEVTVESGDTSLMTDGLEQACKDYDYSQSTIDCLTDGNSVSELQNCE